jgi:hypothetical protein
VATSVVETGDPQPPADGAGWADLDSDAVRDRHTEMLEFTGYVGRDRTLAKVAGGLRREPTPVDAVHAACRWVHEHLTYQRGRASPYVLVRESVRNGSRMSHLGQ